MKLTHFRFSLEAYTDCILSKVIQPKSSFAVTWFCPSLAEKHLARTMVDPGTISPARKEDFDQYVKKYETSRRASTGNVAKTESRRSLQLKGLKANYSDSRELHRASSSRRKLAEVISFRTLAGSKKTLELFYRFMQIKEAASLLEFWFEAENFRK